VDAQVWCAARVAECICRVYPGHGIRFVTRTGQLVVLSGSKVTSMYHQRKKPAKLYWTLASRRAHKKLNTESGTKKRARRVVKVQRGYVGAEKIDEVSGLA
jgi:large subunit ribosomal protein L24e